MDKEEKKLVLDDTEAFKLADYDPEYIEKELERLQKIIDENKDTDTNK